MSCNYKGARSYGHSTCNSPIYRRGRRDGIVEMMHQTRFCDGRFRNCPYYDYDNFYNDAVHNNAYRETEDEWRQTKQSTSISLILFAIVALVVLYFGYQFFAYGYIELPF